MHHYRRSATNGNQKRSNGKFRGKASRNRTSERRRKTTFYGANRQVFSVAVDKTQSLQRCKCNELQAQLVNYPINPSTINYSCKQFARSNFDARQRVQDISRKSNTYHMSGQPHGFMSKKGQSETCKNEERLPVSFQIAFHAMILVQ